MAINKSEDDLPYLLKYFKENYELSNLDENILTEFNDLNNVPKEFIQKLKEEVHKYV